MAVCITQTEHFTVPECLSYWDHKEPGIPTIKSSTNYILRKINMSLLHGGGRGGSVTDNPKSSLPFLPIHCNAFEDIIKIMSYIGAKKLFKGKHSFREN